MTTILAGGRRIEFTWHGPGRTSLPPSSSFTTASDAPRRGGTFPRRSPPGRVRRARLQPRRIRRLRSRRASATAHLHARRGILRLPELLDAAGVRKAFSSAQRRRFHRPAARFDAASLRGSADCCSRRRTFLRGDYRARHRKDARRVPPHRPEARLERHHGGNVDCAFWGWNRAWLDPGFLAWNIEDCLPAVTSVLVVQGRRSVRVPSQVEAIERSAAARFGAASSSGAATAASRPARADAFKDAAFVRGMEKR